MPRPLISLVSHSSEWQCGQAGPGGWRSRPQALQHWMRSSSFAAASQKNWVSGLIAGWVRPDAGVFASGSFRDISALTPAQHDAAGRHVGTARRYRVNSARDLVDRGAAQLADRFGHAVE